MVIAPFILGIIPPLLWLLFFLTEDREHPEPKRMIFYVFFGGGLATVLAAVPELFLQNRFPTDAIAFSPLLVAFSFIEEFAKFFIVYLMIRKNTYFDERVDAMIYMITAGLGFAAFENVLNLIGTDFIVQVTLVRGIGATLLHALASGILGFYWVRRRLAMGLTAATLLHALFNFLVLQLEGIEIYASTLLLFAALVVFHDFDVLKKKDGETQQKRSMLRRSTTT